MKIQTALIASVALAGCATMGNQNQLSGPGIGSVASGVACVVDELGEEGWTIVSRDDAGLVRAEMGANWIQANVVPGDQTVGGTAFEYQLTTANSPAARDAAAEVLEDCGTA